MKFLAGIPSGSALLLAGVLLAGCLPSAQNQSDEEKEPHYLAGKNHVNAMDYKGAIESFEKALEVNPQSGLAHFELGWLYDQKGIEETVAAPAELYTTLRWVLNGPLQPGDGKDVSFKVRIR